MTQIRLPLNVKASCQNLIEDGEVPKWQPVDVPPQRGMAGRRQLSFNVVDVGPTRRVLLSAEQPVSFGIDNPSNRHTLRLRYRARKQRKWEDAGHAFVAPRAGAVVTVDASNNTIVEEMPA